ncbi:hypothetical protein QTJ16_006246 [Diplocarpon rosae]|uniref:Xaa-Pro dipeptidyl-peptidase C-terminal domain-containing protein n=1 Tax=Diplocarpon rosae TaxID=946125 RepID=A0AAD9SVC4_9HELO|nr:hypothetical protein QTJ16_006246 [Diplocarpon rosae]
MTTTTNTIKDILEVTEDRENSLIFEENVSVPLRSSDLPIRCNVYGPMAPASAQFPVLVTSGPYGKDIPYDKYAPESPRRLIPVFVVDTTQFLRQVLQRAQPRTPEQVQCLRDSGSGYAVVRADERGLGQSPGLLDTMSRGTSECFFDVVEWAAAQPWSSGKVGLLGISYYAGSQWRVAARQPQGLAAIIPWEGMSDYYRDRCRHGGILSNASSDFGGIDKSSRTSTVGRAGRRRSGAKTPSREFKLEEIEVVILSVANWGGILLHLRGTKPDCFRVMGDGKLIRASGYVNGYAWAGSKLKYLRFITGRHDLPLYYKEEVEVQKSFLDAFLKGEDRVGWSVPGRVSPVSVILRKGDVGSDNPEAERTYARREAAAWPRSGTEYTKFYLTADQNLESGPPAAPAPHTLSDPALGSLENPRAIQFTSGPFAQDTEITGHVTARLTVSVTPASPSASPEKDIDLILTLRYLSPRGRRGFLHRHGRRPRPSQQGLAPRVPAQDRVEPCPERGLPALPPVQVRGSAGREGRHALRRGRRDLADERGGREGRPDRSRGQLGGYAGQWDFHAYE